MTYVNKSADERQHPSARWWAAYVAGAMMLAGAGAAAVGTGVAAASRAGLPVSGTTVPVPTGSDRDEAVSRWLAELRVNLPAVRATDDWPWKVLRTPPAGVPQHGWSR